jgi:hypothetical protein
MMFVIDAIGSINYAIEAVHDDPSKIACACRLNPKLQLRAAGVCYRDPVDDPLNALEVIHSVLISRGCCNGRKKRCSNRLCWSNQRNSSTSMARRS